MSQYKRVKWSAFDVAIFNGTWPGSNIPEIDITFEFDLSGNLVDIDSEIDSNEFDGPALLALSQDAQVFLFGGDCE